MARRVPALPRQERQRGAHDVGIERASRLPLERLGRVAPPIACRASFTKATAQATMRASSGMS